MEKLKKNPPVNAGNIEMLGSIPGWKRSFGVGNDNLLQYSCLENPLGRVWQAKVHMVAESDMTETT